MSRRPRREEKEDPLMEALVSSLGKSAAFKRLARDLAFDVYQEMAALENELKETA